MQAVEISRSSCGDWSPSPQKEQVSVSEKNAIVTTWGRHLPALPCATYNPCVSEINWNKWESRTMSVAPCLSENLSLTTVNENKNKSSKRWFHRSKYSCAQALNTQVVNLVHFFSHITDLSLRYVDCKIGFLHTYTLQVGDQSRRWTGEPKKKQ